MATRRKSTGKPPLAGTGIDTGHLEELTGYLLRRATSRVMADFVQVAANHDLRPVPFSILLLVESNPGVRQGQVAEALAIKPANMVPLVNMLVERGLLRRRVGVEDRRSFELALTAAGRNVLQQCHAGIAAHEQRLFSVLSATERARLHDMLRRVIQSADNGDQQDL
ncbi:MAG: MarR family transcriptional regulator [Gammaproteobacteria bacterium]|nr:MarR family transcriptional regulator [Gammaproteobacteria bacterium]